MQLRRSDSRSLLRWRLMLIALLACALNCVAAANLPTTSLGTDFSASVIGAFPNPAYFAQTLPDNESQTTDRSFILVQLYDDVSYLLSEPDFLAVAGGLGLAPIAFSSDFHNESPLFTELWGPSRSADGFFELGDMVGNGVFPVLASASSWGIGKISGSSRLRDFGSDLFRAQVVTGLFTTALKGSINRTRPNGAPYSYPSGHTSSAFATAGVVYKHFGRTWGIPAFALAGYVGLSRLQEGKHYLSDVIAGGILGSYISLKLTRRGKKGGPLSIAPRSMSGGPRLSVSYAF